MKKLFLRIKLLYFLFRASRNPENTQAILSIGPCLYKLGYLEHAKQKIYSNQLDSIHIKSRPLLKPINLQTLRKSPSGSLGFVYANHMLSNNLDPNFYNKVPIENDETYFMMWLRQTHDLWHVITGFSTSVEDELGLQAFMLAQTHAPLCPFLLGAAIFLLGLENDIRVIPIMEKITYGWNLGVQSQSLFSVDWDSHWLTPVETLRSQLGLSIINKPKPNEIRINVTH